MVANWIMRRIWDKIKLGNADECWEWEGYRKPDQPYGLLFDGKKYYYAHRLAYEYFNGPIPDGLFVCHKCNNPPCCNPHHLYAGTAKDNMRDKSERFKRGELIFRNRWNPKPKE